MTNSSKDKTIRTTETLIEQGLCDPTQKEKLNQIAEQFSIAITPEISTTIHHPGIAKQFIPAVEEAHIAPNELTDPIGDEPHQKIKGVIHRYTDRCLLLPVSVCPVYCRFCFRREKIGSKQPALSPEELQNAYAYIQNHPEIWEVILTGGDPLILKPKSLDEILKNLTAIPHVDVIRIHTRVPVVDPSRINASLLKVLKIKKPVYIVLHANHPEEFTEAAKKACASLIDHGIPMLSQTVLLKDINDNVDTLSQLMRCFVRNRIKPYYLHHPDLAKGTQHFRIPIRKGQALMKALKKKTSGLCHPQYVLDIPGGYGKIPLQHCYIQEKNADLYSIEDLDGQLHRYEE
ncbi:MAG: lysine-2,3-aminomutase-like protein [Proteobacteria bacterium]|nr:lysine-2,3-aminomutase-like protein [Pseudomonadota bacterium]